MLFLSLVTLGCRVQTWAFYWSDRDLALKYDALTWAAFSCVAAVAFYRVLAVMFEPEETT